MGIGTGIFLLVVGAILAFGVRDNLTDFNLTNIGYICMAAGALGIILALVLQNQRRNTSHTVVQERYDNAPGSTGQPGPGETVVREERRDPGV